MKLRQHDFDLSLSISFAEGIIKGLMVYSVDIFEQETIKQIISNFITLLSSITTEVDTNISRLPLLTDVENQRIIIEWNKKTKH